MTTPVPPVAIYQTEHALTLVVGGRIITTAVASAYGWHLSLGRPAYGDKRTDKGVAYQPVRCHWWSAASREQAIQWLRYLGVARHTGRTA